MLQWKYRVRVIAAKIENNEAQNWTINHENINYETARRKKNKNLRFMKKEKKTVTKSGGESVNKNRKIFAHIYYAIKQWSIGKFFEALTHVDETLI